MAGAECAYQIDDNYEVGDSKEKIQFSELSMKSGSSSQLNAVAIVDVSLVFIHL